MYPLYIVYCHLSSMDDISCYFVIFCVIYLFDVFPFHPHVSLLVLFHSSFPNKARKITYSAAGWKCRWKEWLHRLWKWNIKRKRIIALEKELMIWVCYSKKHDAMCCILVLLRLVTVQKNRSLCFLEIGFLFVWLLKVILKLWCVLSQTWSAWAVWFRGWGI